MAQALVRGFLARREFRRRLAAKREREAAAMRSIAPWARTALHRCRFLALRCPSPQPNSNFLLLVFFLFSPKEI